MSHAPSRSFTEIPSPPEVRQYRRVLCQWLRELVQAMAVCGLLALASVALAQTGDEPDKTQGALSVKGGRGEIPFTELKQILDNSVSSVERLLIMTQCFGGNALEIFEGTKTIISAAKGEEKAVYGFYDIEAAKQLKPGAGRTAKTVHDAATAKKHEDETTTTGGFAAPEDFSLENTSPSGAIRKRYVLVYAGQPTEVQDDGVEVGDKAQRDIIKNNFLSDAGTTVVSVGGDGTDGWDYPATRKGLQDALDAIRVAIDAGNAPEKEQFIMFVTDHGALSNSDGTLIIHRSTFELEYNMILMHQIMETEGVRQTIEAQMQSQIETDPDESDPGEVPGFYSEFGSDENEIQPFNPETDGPIFQPGDIEIEVTPSTNGGSNLRSLLTPMPTSSLISTTLTDFTELYIDLGDADPAFPGIIGDLPGEGVSLFFPYPLELFAEHFVSDLNLTITNNTGSAVSLTGMTLSTGPIMKDIAGEIPEPSTAPEPNTLILAALSLLSLGMTRKRRRR